MELWFPKKHRWTSRQLINYFRCFNSLVSQGISNILINQVCSNIKVLREIIIIVTPWWCSLSMCKVYRHSSQLSNIHIKVRSGRSQGKPLLKVSQFVNSSRGKQRLKMNFSQFVNNPGTNRKRWKGNHSILSRCLRLVKFQGHTHPDHQLLIHLVVDNNNQTTQWKKSCSISKRRSLTFTYAWKH